MDSQADFIPLARPHAGEEEIAALAEVVRSGWWTTGPEVTRFEEEVCRYLGTGLHAVALNSCTAGLFLALEALGIGPGDEVIVPTWTFAATAQVVEWTGARAVLCDIDPATLNIDPERAARCVRPATRAVIPVHMAGRPCEMDPLSELARRHGLHVVEDAAHAMGTRYQGKKVGSFGSLAVFSFYATKNLACGEGGMVVTRDGDLAAAIRRLSYFGIDKEAWRRHPERAPWYYEVVENGYKANMDSLHAALGRVQLARLEKMNARRREIAALYRDRLQGVGFFADDPDDGHSYHLFAVRLPGHVRRDAFMAELRSRGIGSGVHYVPLHRHPHWAAGCDAAAFPGAESIAERTVSLPLYPDLTDAQVEFICREVGRLVGGE